MTMPAIAPPDSSSSFPTTADDSSGSGVETDRCCGGEGEGGAAGGSVERVNVGGSLTVTPRTAVASSAVASFVSSLAAKAMAVVARSSLATAGGVMSTWSGQQLTQNVSAISAKARGELWGQGSGYVRVSCGMPRGTLRMTDPAETVMLTAATPTPTSSATFCSISASFPPV